jgi:hypothetical protein
LLFCARGGLMAGGMRVWQQGKSGTGDYERPN